jgi:hypothetical protein
MPPRDAGGAVAIDISVEAQEGACRIAFVWIANVCFRPKADSRPLPNLAAVSHQRGMEVVAAFNALAESIAGEPISHVWRGYGSAVFLEIGELTPSTKRRSDGSLRNPTGRLSLGVEWSWRVEDATSILCGSWSEKELWSSALDRLREGRISTCKLFGVLPEIELGTDAGIRFLSFSTTDGQPQWWLIDRRGESNRSFAVRDGKLHLDEPILARP